MNFSACVRLAVAAIVTAGASAAFAQRLPNTPALTVAHKSAFLLLHREVLRELALTPTQSAAIQRALEEYSKAQDRLAQDAKATEAAATAVETTFAKSALKALTPKQQERLLGLAVKELGVFALGDPAIAAKIGLSAAQSKTVATHLKTITKRQEKFEDMLALGLDEIPEPKTKEEEAAYAKRQKEVIRMYDAERKKMEEENAKTAQTILALLSPAQKKKWAALTGSASR